VEKVVDQHSPEDEPLLPLWEQVSPEFANAALLAGNGVSSNVWSRFQYNSLYEVARSPHRTNRLVGVDTQLFNALGTRNFERVLRALRISIETNHVFGVTAEPHEARYDGIRQALIESVHAVHVEWLDVAGARLMQLNAALASYRAVFTTSYDLLIYWAMMNAPGAFIDFFWHGCFDIKDTDVMPGRRPVYFLHGGLHLFRDEDGRTCKRVAGGGNLLQLFAADADYREPLFISEGVAADKLRAIRASDYLSFCYESLRRETGPLVIVGHALSDEDEHIVAALQRPHLSVAIGIRANSQEEKDAKTAAYQMKLPAAQRTFFDATTHPLGDVALNVPPHAQ
jgi:hypothetical protein